MANASIFRVPKHDNFTVMSNVHVRDDRLSLKAIGLFTKILSLPEDWDYSKSGLVAICKEGRDSVDSALRELIGCGYIAIVKHQSSSGFWYEYIIQEDPTQKNGNQGTDIPDTETPDTETPDTGFQVLGTNYNKINTLNTENKILNINNIVGEPDDIPYQEIVDYLNECTGQHYRASTDKTRRLIRARFNEGFTLEDFKTVIYKKTKEWGSGNMVKYLRPETLFGTKFEGYLNQVESQDSFESTMTMLERWAEGEDDG